MMLRRIDKKMYSKKVKSENNHFPPSAIATITFYIVFYHGLHSSQLFSSNIHNGVSQSTHFFYLTEQTRKSDKKQRNFENPNFFFTNLQSG